MKYEHKELIHDYLNLERYIKRINKRINKKQIEFNAQSFCGTTEFGGLEIRHRGFRVDDRVCSYVDLINTYRQNIEMNKRRLHYFNRFLTSLDQHTALSLRRRYKKVVYFGEVQELGHDEIVLDEILEIEDAISYEFSTALSNELQRDALQVEYTLFSSDTVEDSFQAMQNLLGV